VLKAKVALDPSGGLEVPMRPPYMPVITERLREAATLYEKAGARSLAAEVRTLSLPSLCLSNKHTRMHAHTHIHRHTLGRGRTHMHTHKHTRTHRHALRHTLCLGCVCSLLMLWPMA
jgi:hypothetical protein